MHDLMTKMQEKKGVQNWYFGIVRTMPYGYGFTREKTPQNNFSSQNFSVENNYFEEHIRHITINLVMHVIGVKCSESSISG